MSNIVEMNNQNSFNTNIMEKISKSDKGCQALIKLFHLTKNPVEPLEDIISDKHLLKCERGRALFQLWNYENETAMSIVDSAIDIVQEAIKTDLNNVSKKIIDIAETAITLFGRLG